jgi:hypothetical protein
LLIILVAWFTFISHAAAAAPDPRITSVYPAAIPAGVRSEVIVRGAGLGEVRGLWSPSGIQANFLSVVPEADGPEPDRTIVRFEVLPSPQLCGIQPIRLITARGLTNELAFTVSEHPVVLENALQRPLDRFPVIASGSIERHGEVDRYPISAGRGEVLTFSVEGAGGLDPVLALVEQSPSWFNPARWNVLSENDEPLHYPGLPHGARITWAFSEPGEYMVEIRSFSGQGNPDYTYVLKIDRGFGEPPSFRPLAGAGWQERSFVRSLNLDREAALLARGGRRVSSFPPQLFEGRLRQAAECHRFRLPLEAPSRIAIEIETPEATLPRFNPVLRLLDADGSEIATNVYTKLNNNGLYMMKMIQAKTILEVPRAGEYALEIRDVTTDVIADDFAYRVLVRPQIAHIGRAEIVPELVNVQAGESKTLTVNLDYEEGFSGLVFAEVDGLPAGVTATVGLAKPVDKPPLPNGGRVERYFADAFAATIVLTAAADAPASDRPVTVRVQLRTASGRLAATPILVREIPLMIVGRGGT